MPSRILICGGGIGGLSLAQGLKKAVIPFHVFERSPAADFRAQGYRVRLVADGSSALESLLDAEHWHLFERTCAANEPGVGRFNALDETISPPTFTLPNRLTGQRPYCVDRTVLRNLLLFGLEEHVSFGKN
jgi:2-polyprenyl-6-methoxyphenol hydroxylase-like FAD-dependent oxidoreductase